MQRKNPFDKSNEIYGSKTLHRETGYYISHLEQYSKSLKFFDEAIKESPDDQRALIGRSVARAQIAQYEGALEDISHALSIDPDELNVLAHKSRNMYLCCEFEEGLVQNLKLMPKRQKPETFKMGVMDCAEAIQNCIGDRAGRPLRDHFRIVRKLAWKRNFEAQKPFEPVPSNKRKKKKRNLLFEKLYEQQQTGEPVQPAKMKGKNKSSDPGLDIRDSLHSKKSSTDKIPSFNQPFPFRPLQNYTSNIENYMAEKYLDHMYLDKVFLKEVTRDSGVENPNNKGSAKLRKIAKECLKCVSYKQELLRTRRPFYYLKYQEGRISGALKARQELELKRQQEAAKREADMIQQKLLEANSENRLRDVLVLTDKLRKYCELRSKKLLPNKSEYMQSIYDTVCKAFYAVYRVNTEQGVFEQNVRIYSLLGVPIGRQVSKDSVIVQIKDTHLDYKKQIRDVEQRLINSVVPEEICWYYHELCRFHLELKQYEISCLYARKCMQQAASIGNHRWAFNSLMLIVKSDLQQHNKNDAKANLQQALSCTLKLKDKDKADFVKKCLVVVDNVQLDDAYGEKELQVREHKIIQMMTGTKMKNEVSHLFRQMAAMPASRRMTVIPGVVVSDSRKGSTKSGRSLSRKSIIPSVPKEDDTLMELKRLKPDKDLMSVIEVHL